MKLDLNGAVKAVAALAVSVGLVVASVTGQTPDFLTAGYVDRIAATVLSIVSVFYALKAPPPSAT